MSRAIHCKGSFVLALLLGLGPAVCNPRSPGSDEAAPAPVDTAPPASGTDTIPTRAPFDSAVGPRPDTSAATPPITPSSQQSDTPPAGAAKPSGPTGGAGSKVGQLEYEGWRQYS